MRTDRHDADFILSIRDTVDYYCFGEVWYCVRPHCPDMRLVKDTLVLEILRALKEEQERIEDARAWDVVPHVESRSYLRIV